MSFSVAYHYDVKEFLVTMGSLSRNVFRHLKGINKIICQVRTLHVNSASAALVAAQEPVSVPQGRQCVTMIPGDGVGRELVGTVKDVFTAAGVPVDFEEIFVSEIQPSMSAETSVVVDSCMKNRVALKGIISTPVNYSGSILQTLNMQIRNDVNAWIWAKGLMELCALLCALLVLYHVG